MDITLQMAALADHVWCYVTGHWICLLSSLYWLQAGPFISLVNILGLIGPGGLKPGVDLNRSSPVLGASCAIVMVNHVTGCLAVVPKLWSHVPLSITQALVPCAFVHNTSFGPMCSLLCCGTKNVVLCAFANICHFVTLHIDADR